MYKTGANHQISITDFNQACGLTLDKSNEWTRLADAIPWERLEILYASLFEGRNGRVAAPFRTALGAIIIQQRLGLTDRGTVKAIAENPYLQYFIGFSGFRTADPFDHTALVKFRKRISAGIINECNEVIIETLKSLEEKAREQEPQKRGPKKADDRPDDNGNMGTAILDATCAPVYIRFPQDSSLLNEAREKLEGMIDWFCREYSFDKKPRTYRRVAHKEYLALAKSKKPTHKQIRATVRKMLGYVARDIGYLEDYMSKGYAPDMKMIGLYLTILELYRQQKYMWDNKVHSVENRIVSLSQSWVRPIVRGKAKTPVEFGPKMEVSIDEDGYARMEQCSFDAFNESERFTAAIEGYFKRTGHWPKRVLVDQIYRTKANIKFCKDHGIRISGPKLGRPSADENLNAKQKRVAKKDHTDRIGVERFFSCGKRCNGMGLIMTRLEETQKTSVALSVLVTNLFGHADAANFFVIFFVESENPCGPQFAIFEDEHIA